MAELRVQSDPRRCAISGCTQPLDSPPHTVTVHLPPEQISAMIVREYKVVDGCLQLALCGGHYHGIAVVPTQGLSIGTGDTQR